MKSETKVLLIGGSAGSISVLFQMLSEINTEIHFPIIIILHRKPYPKSSLSQLFETMTPLKVIEIEDKTEIVHGNIYLVPADYHLLFENEYTISLDASEKVNYSRPSIDVTFESAARTFSNGVTAILLSGASQDGVEGLKKIKQHGGMVAIQDPNTAEVDFMPRHALEHLPDITQLQPEQMAKFINNLN